MNILTSALVALELVLRTPTNQVCLVSVKRIPGSGSSARVRVLHLPTRLRRLSLPDLQCKVVLYPWGAGV